MDKSEFRSMVEKYKSELMKMAGLTVKAAEPQDAIPLTEADAANPTTPGVNPPEQANWNNDNPSQPLPFEQGAPYTGKAAGDDSTQETYQEFLDKNREQGYLKIQAYTARQALPVSGVKVIISKDFSDMKKVFFEGVTDESGVIDNIKLPAPSRLLSETPEDVLPYADYEISSSYGDYITSTQNSPEIQIFQGIKSIQPIIVSPQ